MAVWFALLAITLNTTLPTSAAHADDFDLQRANYDVYAGGFHVVNANLDVDFREQNRYRLMLGAETRGFIGSVAPWNGTFETIGWYDPKTKEAQPEAHVSKAHWKDELEIKEYIYNRDGTFKEYRITDVHSDRELRETEKELSDNTTDVMTAALSVMDHFPESGRCEGSSEIFDGKRRFKLMFIDEGQMQLKKSRYNIYSGPATKCVVKVEPLAGEWHDKPRGWMSIQEQGVQHGKLPTIWMATITEGQPAVPVKILVRSDYGALVMHMTRYQNGPDVLLAEKQPDEEG